jgi:catechol 2,3-dioxygenase-like lactoylglutathione lyase family enzyme
MPLLHIDHLNIAAKDLEASRAFYRETLGFEDGPRPPFSRAGAWMYLGGHPVLHLSTGRKPATRKSDPFDHMAFAAKGLAQMRAHLRAKNIEFLEVAVPDRGQLQLFLFDPDGTEIELVFTGDEAQQAISEGALVDATVHRGTGKKS